MGKNKRQGKLPLNLNNPVRRARRKKASEDEFSIESYLEKEMLRFTTAGSVDDGKSTLIGRLLYDSKSIFQDQMETLEETSRLRGEEQVNLALLTDGLRAEREQGITIDVAYRYFATPRRKFIIADTPGHEQYTRNMVTGASTADVAIILIDARKGVLPQSRRHGIISSLLGIPHLLVAVNKMDLVDWSQDVFDSIVQEYTNFSEKLEIRDISFVPISALTGDNVVSASKKMRWYSGPSILNYLETVTIAADANLQDFRFPVQYVIRPNQDYRGFAGRVESGTIHQGDEIVVLPSGHGSRVKEIHEFTDALDTAFRGQSVSITLEDEIDISRGDMIVRKENVPISSSQLEAIICWMDESKSMTPGTRYMLQHTTRRVQGEISRINYRLDINSLHREHAADLSLNEIGRVEIELSQPLYFDSYRENRITGAFILIDLATNRTVAAGMIRHEKRQAEQTSVPTSTSSSLPANSRKIDLPTRIAKNGHRPLVYFFTGDGADERQESARLLESFLFHSGTSVILLDEHFLESLAQYGAGSEGDSDSTIARIVGALYESGHVVICNAQRGEVFAELLRGALPAGAFYQVNIGQRISVSQGSSQRLAFDSGKDQPADIAAALQRLL